MNKKLLVGGLAVVGAIALIAWYRKPKKNSEGFFNATGGCTRCQRPNGSQYTPNAWGCINGAKCIQKASIQE